MAKILLMAASLRQGSCNKKLINLVEKLGVEQNIEIKQLNFTDFIAPLYSGDIEENSGLPDVVEGFIAKLKDADGLVIASPEYNFSTPGTLKNLLDWVSRARPMPWVKYPVMLCSASPALAGGSRGLLHTVATLQCACNAYIYPPMFSLGNAYEAFTSDGSLQDKELEKRLGKNILGFVDFVKKLR